MDFYEDEPLQAKKVLEMLTVANEYCLFIEKAASYPREEVLDYLLKISPLLYLKGILMPAVEAGDDYIALRYVTEEQWENVFTSLRSVFGEQDGYQAHFFREAYEQEENRCSLAENFADVYQDLKDFVLAYQNRTFSSQSNAVILCTKLFTRHWGPRLLESMPPIHQLSYPDSTREIKDEPIIF